MLDNLYENIGGKVKSLAKCAFIVEAIGAIITGFVLVASDSGLAFYGLLTIVFGPIVAWVSSWILYAFGELVDKTCALAEKNGITDKHTEVSKTSNSPVSKKSNYSNGGKQTFVTAKNNSTIVCPLCDCEQPSGSIRCWRCGAKFIENDK